MMTDDKDIDALLRTAVATEDRAVPEDLMARVLADAERLQPSPAPRPQAPHGRISWLDGLLESIGGWLGPAAVAASLFVGIGLGATDTATFADLPSALGLASMQSTADTDVLESFGLGGFDLSAAEW